MNTATLDEAERFDPTRDPQKSRQKLIILLLAMLLATALVGASMVGALSIPISHVLAALAQKLGVDVGPAVSSLESAALFAIRLPRIALGVGAGAMLGLSGAVIQALFRNALADPALIGISGGAACGAVGWIVLGASLPAWLPETWALPLAAFLASLAAAAGIYRIASRASRADVASLLLAGIAINALCGALVGYLTYLGSDAQLRALTFWLLGGLSGATWSQIWPALLIMGASILGLLPRAREFDVMTLGDNAAQHLGLKVESIRRSTIACVALGAGASVALTGVIGFVGLLAPHVVRMLGGSSHRYVLLGSALLGALLLVLADLIARIVVAPAELPIGIVTSALGAPLFIRLIRQRAAAHAL